MLQFELRPALWREDLGEQQVMPNCEIVDSKEAFSIYLDAPGVFKEDIELEVLERQLHVRTERRARALGAQERLVRQEKRFGKSHRAFQLPEGIDEQGITARLRDGVLEIHLPKITVAAKKILVN